MHVRDSASLLLLLLLGMVVEVVVLPGESWDLNQ
jgi:hypothetical protein